MIRAWREPRKGRKFGETTLPARTDRPKVGTLIGLTATYLDRLIDFLPAYRTAMRHLVGADADRMQFSLEGPLKDFENVIDELQRAYARNVRYVQGKNTDGPRRPADTVAFWLDAFFYRDTCLKEELARQTYIDGAYNIDFMAYCIATGQAARHAAPNGAVTVYPVL